MTQEELTAIAGKLYRILLRRSRSPGEAMHVIAAVAYVIYRNAPKGYPLADFCSELSAAIQELHQMNDVKGTA